MKLRKIMAAALAAVCAVSATTAISFAADPTDAGVVPDGGIGTPTTDPDQGDLTTDEDDGTGVTVASVDVVELGNWAGSYEFSKADLKFNLRVGDLIVIDVDAFEADAQVGIQSGKWGNLENAGFVDVTERAYIQIPVTQALIDELEANARDDGNYLVVKGKNATLKGVLIDHEEAQGAPVAVTPTTPAEPEEPKAPVEGEAPELSEDEYDYIVSIDFEGDGDWIAYEGDELWDMLFGEDDAPDAGDVTNLYIVGPEGSEIKLEYRPVGGGWSDAGDYADTIDLEGDDLEDLNLGEDDPDEGHYLKLSSNSGEMTVNVGMVVKAGSSANKDNAGGVTNKDDSSTASTTSTTSGTASTATATSGAAGTTGTATGDAANPATGVAMVVAPVLIAGAVAVVSKKRK